tara:strand:- start:350 stop:559 length:210 start_codon:yes stop_codon:yes gene_type:complete
MSSDYDKLVKKSLQAGWSDMMSREERSQYIKEVERWLLYRGTNRDWHEKALKALLQEIYALEDEKGNKQ